MNWAELSVRRHVLAAMMSIVLVLFGLIGYTRIGVDRFPEIEFPIISISTVLPGADPETIDASITNVIESAVNSIPGIDFVSSTSASNASLVLVQFVLSKDIDVAFNEVQAKVSQVLRRLPREADPPVVQKVEFGADPVMWLSLTGDRTLQQLNQYARNVISKRLETIDGVGEVRLGGRRDRTIRVELDLDRMAAFGVDPRDVAAAFGREHIRLPGGFLVSGETERQINLDLEFHSVEALAGMVVRFVDGAPVRLSDIGRVVDGLADFRQLARVNGEPAIGIGIVKVSGANTVAVVDEVRRRIAEEIQPELPPGLELDVVVDNSGPIREIIGALQEHLVEGTLLAGLVVFLFLRSFRSTLIISTAIPVSLLGAIAAMYFMGYTFNVMTLLALLLLIGVVVDDAIVVLENIHRHREQHGEDLRTAAVKGTNEVVFAVVAASLTLVSIFASVIFLGGIIGRFFESFAVVVAVGVLVSLMVSLTLTPMLCSRFLRVEGPQNRFYLALDAGFRRLDAAYRRALRGALAHRWAVLGVSALVVASSGWFLANIDSGFSPEEDEGRFIISFRTPLGASIEQTDQALREIEAVLARQPEITRYFTAIGLGADGQVSRGFASVTMLPRNERRISQQQLLARVRAELAEIPGVRAFATSPPVVGGQRGEPLQFSVVGPELEETAAASQRLLDALNARPELGRVDLDLQLGLPQLRVEVDRVRAANLGLAAGDVAAAINLLASGVDVARYNDEPSDGERYEIRVKAAYGQLEDIEDLRRIFLRNARGEMIRLDSVATLVPRIGPASITRFDLQYSGNFFVTPDIALGAAVDVVREVAAEVLPPGYTLRLQGQAREFEATIGYILFSLVLAVTLVYIVLSSQFNSFVQPLVVMLAQPLAIIGGIFALWITGHGLNIFSMIGLVLLMGLVAKNSILLVDLTNQYRERGMGVNEALHAACPIRLRPVLMTSLTVILALTPPALGLGAGANTNAPLAVAVIGGMVSSTLLTLVVVPAVYSLVENGLERLGRSKRAAEALDAT